MKIKEQQLKLHFLNYIQAFAQQSIEQVSQCYQLPCVLSTPEKVVVLANEQSLSKEFNGIFSMLKENAIAAFKANNASYENIDENLVLVKIDWQFFDNANNLFTEFSAIYHLSYQENQFKIVNVISHDMCDLSSLANPLTLNEEQ